MNITKFFLVFLTPIVSFFLLTSCGSDQLRNASEPFEVDNVLIEDRFESEGHWYIYFQYPNKTDYVILHDPDCDCPSRW